MTESDRWSREIACDDHIGRSRSLTVFISENRRVALFAPAGEVAVLTPPQLADLRKALNDAEVEAMAQRLSP